jgi:hypothetical protein
VTAEFRVEGFPLFYYWIMKVSLTPGRDRLETAAKALLHGPDVDRELPSPAACADVRETQEVECFRLLPTLGLGSRQGFAPELDEPSFLRVEGQSVLGKPLGQYFLHFFGILAVLEAEDKIIGVSDQVGLPS